MRIVVISAQNSLLSGAIVKYLRERGELRPERVGGEQVRELDKVCLALNAGVLLMEVTRTPPFDLEGRAAVIRRVRAALPACRIALLCDETADPALAAQVALARKQGLIDGFFFSSVTGDYLAAALDAL